MNTLMEEWKPVKNYPDYLISNFGVIKNKYGKLLKLRKINGGYFQVCLCKDSKPRYFLIHRLVAEAFIPNPDNLSEINHKDENKQNNCVDNLEWCTHEYNMHYGNCSNKIAKSHLGVKRPKCVCETLSKVRMGKKHDEVTKRKISKSVKQSWKRRKIK